MPDPNGVYLPTGEEKRNASMQMRMDLPCGTMVPLEYRSNGWGNLVSSGKESVMTSGPREAGKTLS